MNRLFLFLLFFLTTLNYSFSQSSLTQQKVFTQDIDNFWIAYDSIQQTSNYSKRLDFINRLYINKGTKGLKAFMKVQNYNDTVYVKLIDEFPKFWSSIRLNTFSVKNKAKELNIAIKNLKKIYPELKEAQIYFLIGDLSAGGQTTDNMVLIGTEIATGDSRTDVSEFKNNWLKSVFANKPTDNTVSLNLHEYIHTQQKKINTTLLLKQAIAEGSADFIAQLVLRTPLRSNYSSYGDQHFDNLKKKFKEEMFSSSFADWLYNGSQKGESADLGYYMGYKICESYYNNAKNKSQAIKEIIELNYSDEIAVENFLMKSKFFKKKKDIKKLIKAHNEKFPHIVKIEPFKNGAKNVSSELKEIKITFSKEMITGNYSIDYSKRGIDFWPIKDIKGFENNDKTIVISVDLKPNKEYEFIITNESFKSKDGYPLKEEEYPVKFKTK